MAESIINVLCYNRRPFHERYLHNHPLVKVSQKLAEKTKLLIKNFVQ